MSKSTSLPKIDLGTQKRFDHKLIESIKLVSEQVDGRRYYTTPEGNKYRSITTALSNYNKQYIIEWRNRVGEQEANRISRAATARGTKIHKICERYVLNDSNYLEGTNIIQQQMFLPIKEYLDSYCDLVYGSEVSMYSDKLQLAGTCDLVARVHGLPCIVDFKTASKPKKQENINNYFMQAAAYAAMAYERHNIICSWVLILIATEHEGLQAFYKQTKPYYKMLREYLAVESTN